MTKPVKQRKLLMGERERLLSYAQEKARPEPESIALKEIVASRTDPR